MKENPKKSGAEDLRNQPDRLIPDPPPNADSPDTPNPAAHQSGDSSAGFSQDFDPTDRVEMLFHELIDLPVENRSDYLAKACGDNIQLRREVEILLTANESTDSILDTPVCHAVMANRKNLVLQKGASIGGYDIVRLLGSGGMGHVYEAVQPRPRRTVALKILQSGFVTESELRRFQYEAELLGRLRHPNIAQVYDAGIHDDGVMRVPFFAMELVPEPRNIIDFAKQRKLTRDEKLKLFRRICDAVQHGHQKGIVHRDLKPGNILVDPSGVPKIIDYGVAHVADTDMCMTTVKSSAEAFVGTLQYMSPEQFAADARDVDTRSDVYALGLILFELLAFQRPYELAGKSLSQAVRLIETSPPKTLAQLDPTLRGDLSTITETAMAKERELRYQTPIELAADIQRFLANKPIQARSISTWYRIRKFTSRHKALVTGCAVAMAAIVMGGALAGWQYGVAIRERNAAQFEAMKSARTIAFLNSVVKAADPRDSDAGLSVRDALMKASADVEETLGDVPDLYIDVNRMIAGVYTRLDELELAEKHFKLAIDKSAMEYGRKHKNTACLLEDLGWVYDTNRLSEALAAFTEAVEIHKAHFGENSQDIPRLQSYRAMCMNGQGQYENARTLLLETIPRLESAYGSQSEHVAIAKRFLANTEVALGHNKKAEELFKDVIRMQTVAYGPDHYETTFAMTSLANLLISQGRVSEAQPLLESAARVKRMRFGQDCPPGGE